MSSIKEHMHEHAGLQISFDCPNCATTIEEEVEDASFDWSDDSPADGIGTAETVVICPKCGHEEVVCVTAQGIGKTVVLQDTRGVSVNFRDNTFDDDGYDSASDEYIPYDADEVFQISMRELGEVDVTTLGPARQVLLKMVYLQSIVALEAYLSDRLVKLILDDEKKLIQLVKRTKKFKNHPLTLESIADDKNYMKNHVKKYLHEFSFHKLRDVSTFYKAVLSIDIFRNESEADELDGIITMRHHIVHRNGRDNDDKQIGVAPKRPDMLRFEIAS